MIKKQIQQTYLKYTVPLVITSMSFASLAADISNVTTGKNANGEYEVQILGSDFRGVQSYSLDNPARIVVDIPNARSHLSSRVKNVSHPSVSNVAIIEGDDRVRATINLSKAMPYKLVEGSDRITVVIKTVSSPAVVPKRQLSVASGRADVGFERGSDGQGKVKVQLPVGATVDVDRQGTTVRARITGGSFSQTKRLNVNGFGTPVKSIDVFRNSLSIATSSNDFEIVSYQSENTFWIEFNKPTKQDIEQAQLLPGDSRKKYIGEPLSLNFQDIGMRAVLQLIGDFTNTNIVVSDSVQGSITLRLNNVPWDQALDIILQTKGLSMQKNGDVIYVAPIAEITKARTENYKLTRVDETMAPLQQQLIQVQYAKADEIEKIIEDNSSTNSKQEGRGLLSPRGGISTDARTNTLIVNDVASSIDKVRQLVAKLDVPVDQVLIDARIVTATNAFAHDLGVRFGGAGRKVSDSGKLGLAASGTLEDNVGMFKSNKTDLGKRLGVNMPASNASAFGLSLLGKDFLVDLELSAMQNDGRGEIISSPRVIAQDGGKAEIKQGTQIAYSIVDKNGRMMTTWKEIPLRLNVKPKIAPNSQIDMELQIEKSSPGNIYNGEQGIDTNQITTKVLVDNGETVVLGGIYEQTKTKSVSKVPGLGDLPMVGPLFRKDTNSVKKSELLIFVTPKIIDKRFTSRDKFSDLRN